MCANAYVVDIIQGRATAAASEVDVTWAGAVPTDPVTCGGAHLMAYAWSTYIDDSGATITQYLGSSQPYGKWISSFPNPTNPTISSYCSLPVITRTDWVTSATPAGSQFQVAVSARTSDNSMARVTVSVR